MLIKKTKQLWKFSIHNRYAEKRILLFVKEKKLIFSILIVQLFLEFCTSEIKTSLLVCLHDQNKSGSLEGRLFSSQSELVEYFSIALIGWIRPFKKATFVLIM